MILMTQPTPTTKSISMPCGQSIIIHSLSTTMMPLPLVAPKPEFFTITISSTMATQEHLLSPIQLVLTISLDLLLLATMLLALQLAALLPYLSLMVLMVGTLLELAPSESSLLAKLWSLILHIQILPANGLLLLEPNCMLTG